MNIDDGLSTAIKQTRGCPCDGCDLYSSCAERSLCCASWRAWCGLSNTVKLVKSNGNRVSLKAARGHSMRSVDEYYQIRKDIERERNKESEK